MAKELYQCRTCHEEVEAKREGTSAVMRGGRVLLVCGHTGSVGSVRFEFDEASELSDEETRELFERLEAPDRPEII